MEIHQQVKNQQTSNFQDFPEKLAMRPPSRPKSSQNDRQLRQLGSEPPVLVSFSAGLWGRLQGMVAVGLKPTNKHQKIADFGAKSLPKKKTSWGFNQSNI